MKDADEVKTGTRVTIARKKGNRKICPACNGTGRVRRHAARVECNECKGRGHRS